MRGRSRFKRLLGFLLLTLALRPRRGASASTGGLLLSPIYLMRTYETPLAVALLPRAPKTMSPVPGLTSLHHKAYRGPYGNPAYPGNCSGELIKDVLRYFKPKRVLDPMTGSGTCADVCREIGIECRSTDLHDTRFEGADACDPGSYQNIGTFNYVWLHPPYWRQKVYSNDPRDLSTSRTPEEFLSRYKILIDNCASVLEPGAKLAILMGDYSDREAGFVPLVYHTKRLCFEAGLKQACTDIIRFSHGSKCSTKTYRSSFIPMLHEVCSIFEKIDSTTEMACVSHEFSPTHSV